MTLSSFGITYMKAHSMLPHLFLVFAVAPLLRSYVSLLNR